MHTQNKIPLTRKSIYAIMLLGILLSAFAAGSLPTARAQQAGTDTPTPEATATTASTPISDPYTSISYLPELENILPSELRDAIEETLINRPSGKLQGDSLTDVTQSGEPAASN